MVTQVLEQMPRGVKGALAVVWCQAVLNFLGLVIAALIGRTMLGAPAREWFSR